jgi:hypothetical protein
MGNSAKSRFYSVLFNKFHPKTILMAFFVTITGSRNQKKYLEFWIQISPKKGENFEFCWRNFTVEQIQRHFWCIFWVRKQKLKLKFLIFDIQRVPPIQILLRKFYRRTNSMGLVITILGSKNQKKYTEFWNFPS